MDNTGQNRENGRRSELMIVAAMLIFGTIGVFRRYIPLPSAFIAAFRGIAGGLFILAFSRLSGRAAGEKLPLGTAVWFAVSGALIGFNWMLLFEAYEHTTVAVATLCYYMQPTIVMLLSPLILKEKLTVRKAVCAAVAIAGMVLISGVTLGGVKADADGVLLGLGAAALYSAVVIMNKKVSGIDAYRKTTIQLLSAGIVMIPYLMLSGTFFTGMPDMRTVLMLIVVGILHTGLAYVLYFGSMDGLKAQSVALISYIDPVSALLFSALILKEPLSTTGIIGAVMIIGSAVLSELQ